MNYNRQNMGHGLWYGHHHHHHHGHHYYPHGYYPPPTVIVPAAGYYPFQNNYDQGVSILKR